MFCWPRELRRSCGDFWQERASITFTFDGGGLGTPTVPLFTNTIVVTLPILGPYTAPQWIFDGTNWSPNAGNTNMLQNAGVNPAQLLGLPGWAGASPTWTLTMPMSTFWTYIPEDPLALENFNLENYNELASTLTHSDTTTVAGGISTFTKTFNYQSGITCTNC